MEVVSSVVSRERCNAAFRVGDFASAEALYCSALAAAESNGEDDAAALALSNRAMARLKLGKSSQALNDCERGLALMPNDIKLLLRKAMAQQEMFFFDQAVETLGKLLQLPNIPSSTAEVARLKRNQVAKLAREYVPPPLSAFEKDALVAKCHAFRVILQDSDLKATVQPGRHNFTFQLSLGNEFGLFNSFGNFLDGSVMLQHSCTLTSIKSSLPRGDSAFSEHGRLHCSLQLDIPKQLVGSIFQLEFSTDNPLILPVLTLPVAIESPDSNGSSDRFDWGNTYGVGFACCRKLTFAGLPESIQIFESPGDLGIAGKLWDGGVVLLDSLCSLDGVAARHVAKRRVLELGAGTGLVGVGCALLGACRVSITDLHDVLNQIRANVALNRSNLDACGTIEVCELAWGKTPVETLSPVDTVVLADCIYDPDYYSDLHLTLVALKNHNPGLTIVLAHRHRNPADFRMFQLLVHDFQFQLIRGPGPNFSEGAENEKSRGDGSSENIDFQALRQAMIGPEIHACPEVTVGLNQQISVYTLR